MQLANMRGCFLLTTKSVGHCLGLLLLVTCRLYIVCQGKYPFSAVEDFMKFPRVAEQL